MRKLARPPKPSVLRRAEVQGEGAPLRYVGPTALTARGPISGRIYRFEQSGAALSVDPRDWRALVRVPGLEPASGDNT